MHHDVRDIAIFLAIEQNLKWLNSYKLFEDIEI